MDYGAITIDTSIFDANGLKLETGLFKTLSQFKHSPTNILLSEIVIRELTNHLYKKVKEVKLQTEKAFKECQTHLGVTSEIIADAKALILDERDDEKIVSERIDKFINNTGLVIVPATDKIDMSMLLDKYFTGKAPFSDTGKKKSEFPDAIALMTLETWAKDNGVKIVAVSSDGDWLDYGKESEYIDVFPDLAEAIAIFQPRNTAYAFCMKLAEDLPNGKADKILDAIHDYLLYKIQEIDLAPDAGSDYHFEADYVEVDFTDFEIITNNENKAILQPVEIEANSVVIELKIKIEAEASCHFSLSAWDSIDREYVPMSGTTATTYFDFETEILLTLVGDFENGLERIEVTDYEILNIPTDVDFGYIEPDWHGER